jgi:two-component system, chemotaxis family, chemotaxis protein CheY
MAKTIFIVDDSLTMLMSLKGRLELAGFKVETAEDGVQAIEKLGTGLKPNLIITDINMPNMDGIEFLRQARDLTNCRFVPILMLTVLDVAMEKRNEVRRIGATGWLVKPISDHDLLDMINLVLPSP